MPNYRRAVVPGGTWFFTINLLERHGNDLLVHEIDLLRETVRRVRHKHPFHIDAWVVLPEHLRCVLTLPPGDSDFSRRWRLIKSGFSRALPKTEHRSPVRQAAGERGIWQRHYWEHLIRDENNFRRHVDYVHVNPLKHGHVQRVRDWPNFMFHRYVAAGIYPMDWCGDVSVDVAGDSCHASDYAMLIGPTRSYGSKAMSASNFAVQVAIGCCLFGWMPISDSAGCNPLFLKTGEGVYVERVYDKILDESRSPLAARLGAGVNEYFIANVEQTKSGDFHFSFNNFHDSTNGFRVNSCGELTETFGLRPREFRELGSLSFQFIVDGKEKTYRYVGNIDRHLMEKVLVGVYTDEAGKTYQFLSTGVAVFPDRSFSYRVDADLLMNNFDRFCETSSTGANIRCTGYKFNKTELHLYEDISFKSNGPSERSVFDVTRPHLVLKPKSN